MKRIRIGAIAPASMYDPKIVEASKHIFAALGADLVFTTPQMAQFGNFAASDKERAQEFVRMWLDDSLDGIIAVRGGYGCGRMAEHVDWARLVSVRKPLFGYSDITFILNCMVSHKIATPYHSPMLNDIVKNSDFKAAETIIDIIVNRQNRSSFIQFCSNNSQRGTAQGLIIGGNLSVVASMLGTPQWSVIDGSILFLEDTGDFMFRYDRMLNQLKRSGLFDRVRGVIYGAFVAKDPSLPNSIGFEAEELLLSYVPSGIPCVLNAPYGHGEQNGILPIGVEVELNVQNNVVTIAIV